MEDEIFVPYELICNKDKEILYQKYPEGCVGYILCFSSFKSAQKHYGKNIHIEKLFHISDEQSVVKEPSKLKKQWNKIWYEIKKNVHSLIFDWD